MLSVFPRGVLDEIWYVIGSVSEVFLTFSYNRFSFILQQISFQLLYTFGLKSKRKGTPSRGSNSSISNPACLLRSQNAKILKERTSFLRAKIPYY